MIKYFRFLTIVPLICLYVISCTNMPCHYPIEPVPFNEIIISDNFWAQRVETNREVTRPYALWANGEIGEMAVWLPYSKKE